MEAVQGDEAMKYEKGQVYMAPSGKCTITVLGVSNGGQTVKIQNSVNREPTYMPADTDLSDWMLSGPEVRVTDPKTGGQKGQKESQLGAIDPLALTELGKVAGFGAAKYERANFLKGYAWSLTLDALFRHLLALAAGEDRDPESGHLHASHAMWHCATLTSFTLRGLGTDDRLKYVPGATPNTEIDQGGL